MQVRCPVSRSQARRSRACQPGSGDDRCRRRPRRRRLAQLVAADGEHDAALVELGDLVVVGDEVATGEGARVDEDPFECPRP